MMRLSQLRIALQFTDQSIVANRLLDAQPGKERHEEQHGDNRNIVRRRDNLPKLVPVLD